MRKKTLMSEQEQQKISNSQIDKAGKIIKNETSRNTKYSRSIRSIKEWRSNHSASLKSTRYHIEHEGKKVDNKSLTIQRLKRIVSIENKIKRSTVRLSKMQDVGGCRIIISDIDKLMQLYNNLVKASPKEKEIIGDFNYVKNPNIKTGYRGIHLIYKCYDKYQIEAQLRTKIQHCWATAVEIAGAFIGQNIKSGIVDSEYQQWIDFFRLSSILFAKKENEKNKICTIVDDNLDCVKKKLILVEKQINALYKLETYSISAKETIENTNLFEKAEHFVISMNEQTGELIVYVYGKQSEKKAQQQYNILEKATIKNSAINIVLVSAKSIKDIEIGFPNYFADSKLFISELKNILFDA